MPLTYNVPVGVKTAAQSGLEAAKRGPKLEDVYGYSVADALASGHVPLDLVSRMHRFFSVNRLQYLDEMQRLHTEEDSALVRSWMLYGGDEGHTWAESSFKQAVQDGLIPDDPILELLEMRPEDVYLRFSLGAWRYEYDLDPRKAAIFVEQYQQATGLPLDLRQAFGTSAESVGNAIYRRYNAPNPFKEAMKALRSADVDYRLAANTDVSEMVSSIGYDTQLQESVFPKAQWGSGLSAARIVWSPFVAYCVLSVEQPKLLEMLNANSRKPPKLEDKPKSYRNYHDAINTYIAYFHPTGKRYVNPAKSQFEGVDAEVADFMEKVFHRKPVHRSQVLGTLKRVRKWTVENKLANGLFHIFNVDWAKGDWKHILDNIPEDADVRGAFRDFVNQRKGVSTTS